MCNNMANKKKRGRPTLPKGRALNIRLTVRINPELEERIQRAAELCGMAVQDFARHVLGGAADQAIAASEAA